MHHYNYGDNCLDLTKLPRAKFVSEFGHQSWPSWALYKHVTEPEDWSYNSTMSEFRCGCHSVLWLCSACHLRGKPGMGA